MSPTPPPGRHDAADRFARFAAAVRARTDRMQGTRAAWRPGRHHARRYTGPRTVDRVLRRPIRTAPHHHWHRAPGAPWDLRLTLLTAPSAGAPPSRNAWRPAAARDGDRAAAARSGTPARPWPLRLGPVHRPTARTVRRETVLRRVTATGVPATVPAPGAMPLRRPQAGGPTPAPLVHRRPTPPGPGPGADRVPTATAASHHPVAPGAAGPARGPFDQPPLGRTAPALTATDMPVVVDHVVREIDRRLVAARERKGWFA
ncbi:hypothetical protein ACQEVG_12755 [Streptomyces sp. CA-135486]|uniref:hypothetical protein n=1 Tax=Streptomyces sp. CA-135486 TaxID=3240049 RepID=UPI003D8B0A43